MLKGTSCRAVMIAQPTMSNGRDSGARDRHALRDTDGALPTRPVKRSFSISGHRTSISLETAFWDALRDIADERQQSLASLVAHIDRERGDAGLSGAVRVWLLDHYRRRRESN